MRKDSERPEGAWVERPYLTGNEDSSFMPRYERPSWPESTRRGVPKGVENGGVVDEKKSRKRPGISPGRVVLFVLAFALVGLAGFVAGRAYEHAEATGAPVGAVLADRLHIPESALMPVKRPVGSAPIGSPVRVTHEAAGGGDGMSQADVEPQGKADDANEPDVEAVQQNGQPETDPDVEAPEEEGEKGTPWEVGHPDFEAGNMGFGYVSKGVARHVGIGPLAVFLQIVHDLAYEEPGAAERHYRIMYPTPEKLEEMRNRHEYVPLKPSY